MRLISFLWFLTMAFMAYGKPEIKHEDIDARTDHAVKVSNAFLRGKYFEVLNALPKLNQDFSEIREEDTLSEALKKQQIKKELFVKYEEITSHLQYLYIKANDLLKQDAYTVFTITKLCNFFATYEKKYGETTYKNLFSLWEKKFEDLIPSSMLSSQKHLFQAFAGITYVPFYECFWLAAAEKPEVVAKETWQAFYKSSAIENFFYHILKMDYQAADKLLYVNKLSILSQVALYCESEEQKNILGNILLKKLLYQGVLRSFMRHTGALEDLDLMLRSMRSPNIEDMRFFLKELKSYFDLVGEYADSAHSDAIHKLLATINRKIKSSSVVSKL